MIEGLSRDRVVGSRFKLLRCLGEGGMGEVWAAQHLVTKKTVALKFVKAESDVARKRFLREAMAASAVRHRNVVQVHDVLDHESMPFIVMDCLEGETLERRIGRQLRLTWEETADVLLPVVSAVGTAHAEGIIHRDLKPANIFLTKDDEAIVLDFGIAKIIDDQDMGSSALTRGGSIVGTPHYMAPEQLFGEPIDHRIDVYALGVVMYECLSGKRPAPGENVGQILKTLVAGRVTAIDLLAPELPEDVAKLVMSMLKPRAQRPELEEVMRVLRIYSPRPVPDFEAPRGARVPTTGGDSAISTSDAETATATLELAGANGANGATPGSGGSFTGAPVARSAAARLSARSGVAVAMAVVAASAFAVVAIWVALRGRAAAVVRADAAVGTAAEMPSLGGASVEATRGLGLHAAEGREAEARAVDTSMASAIAPAVVPTPTAPTKRAPAASKARPANPAAVNAAPAVAAPVAGPNGAPILD